ncbi:MAG: cupredoxin domain-containing protein [Candidatus Eremiobacteraeota bacterium]|nr:cupredoxin domain-containing protein [Candidatus Eremiobacteraeota bacterium]MBV8281889.1 cupredoxin domain-containing protein [Candidatus Eremiobacteraeota bacterium]
MGSSISRLFAAFAGVTVLMIAAPAFAHPTVDIVASNWKFTPGTIEMHVGETTVMHITSSGGVHGIQSDDLGIAQTTIKPGEFVDVSVTPKKAGTYVIHCSIPCGGGHGDMTLTVEVKP